MNKRQIGITAAAGVGAAWLAGGVIALTGGHAAAPAPTATRAAVSAPIAGAPVDVPGAVPSATPLPASTPTPAPTGTPAATPTATPGAVAPAIDPSKQAMTCQSGYHAVWTAGLPYPQDWSCQPNPAAPTPLP